MAFRLANTQSLKLLRSIAYGEVSMLVPRVDNEIYYPRVVEVSFVSKAESLKIVTTLWEQGYLQRTFYGRVIKCPQDGTTNIRPHLLCPKCQNEDIEKANLIEHLVCRHVDIEKNFQKGNDYVCPKDKKAQPNRRRLP